MAHILVVDDDPAIRSIIRAFLEIDDHQISEAEDGFQALELIKNGRFDFFVLDYMMPRMDGITLCRKIRQELKITTPPVLFLSVNDSHISQQEAIDNGGNAYLIKPIRMDLLLSTVRDLLQD
ncbi:MAG TPA: response regulator [Anaerolineae bacterium]|nr:response regulator [Anaerolineae bacterium]